MTIKVTTLPSSSLAPSSSLSLAAQTIEALHETFERRNLHPSRAMWEGITSLARYLQDMADGKCEPKFFLSSLDPGVGKTQTVIHFVRSLLRSPDHEHVGVIVLMFTKQQIKDVVSKAGLSEADFAVMLEETEENEELNQLGNQTPNSARVLFTSQQRLQKVCVDRSFEEVHTFHFKDRVRSVRIWDEDLLPASPITIGMDKIAQLFDPLRARHPALVLGLEELWNAAKEGKDRSILNVPDLVSDYGVSWRQALSLLEKHSQEVKDAAAQLWWLFGKTVSIRSDGNRGNTLVSYRDSLPPDLAPIVILDASGRIRTTYRWWEERRKTLVRLTVGAKRYDKLVLHVWPIGGGMSSFDEEEGWKKRLAGIAVAVNSRADEQWLVVCHKKYCERLANDLAGLLVGNPARVQFLHWGIHRATNEYMNVPNIVLAGTPFLPPSAYEAIGRAAWGLSAEHEIPASDERDLIVGEHCHYILQAVCRVSARKCHDDQCAPCRAYLIMAPKHGSPRALLNELFPGCQIEDWEPVKRSLSGKAAAAASFIIGWLGEHPDDVLRFKTVMETIGEHDAPNFGRLRRNPRFREALDEAGIQEDRRGRQRARGFVLCEDDEEEFEEGTFEDYFGPNVTQIGEATSTAAGE